MSAYTNQQLQGGLRFKSSTRIGNWTEDVFLEEAMLREYHAKKTAGSLKSDQLAQRKDTALAPCSLSSCSSSAPKTAHVGDVVQLANPASGLVLANDVSNTDPRAGRERTIGVSASQYSQSCARNTFIIRHFPRKQASCGAVLTSSSANDESENDDVLRYDDKVAIVANTMAIRYNEPLADGGPEPLYLKSGPVNTMDFAKQSRHQEVTMSPGLDRYAAWRIVPRAPAMSAELAGTSVQESDDVVLLHCATHQALSCGREHHTVENDFGKEREVCAHNFSSFASSSRSESMRNGTPELSKERPLLDNNIWRISNGGGSTIKQLATSRSSELESEQSDMIILKKVIDSGVSIDQLHDCLDCMDGSASNVLKPQDVNLALAQLGARELSQADLSTLTSTFDTGRHGKIDYQALVRRMAQLKHEHNAHN
jgi:hypothetical protein